MARLPDAGARNAMPFARNVRRYWMAILRRTVDRVRFTKRRGEIELQDLASRFHVHYPLCPGRRRDFHA